MTFTICLRICLSSYSFCTGGKMEKRIWNLKFQFRKSWSVSNLDFPTTSSKVYIVSINITSMECWRHNCKLSFFVISKRLSKGEGELIEVDAIKWFSLQCSAQLLYVIPWCTASIFTLYVRPVLLHTVLFEQRPIFLWSTMTFWLLTLCLLLDVIK